MSSIPKPEFSSDLEGVLSRSRMIVCAGAGGVGKTTLSAAIAVRATRRGRRTICLTIDPARRLADGLGVEPGVGTDLTDITPMLGRDVLPGGSLSFGMLDPAQAFDRLVQTRTSSKESASRILENRLYRYVSSSLSGVQEYMALTELAGLAERTDIDLVVLDTPPTTNAMDFFTAPQRLSEALDGTLVRLMRRAYGGGKSGFDLLGRSTAALLGALSRFTGQELLSEMMEFVDALSDLFGSFETEARQVEQLLRSSKVAVCLVTTADRATLRESKELRGRLGLLGMRIDAVLFNRCHTPQVPMAPTHLSPSIGLELDELNREWNQQAAREQELIESTAASWQGLATVIRLPLLPESGSRLFLLDRIGDSLWS